MPTDFEIDENGQTEYDEVGDWGQVSGLDAVAQAVTIAIWEQADLSAPSFQSVAIEEQRGTIESVVRRHPWTQEPISVTIFEKDTDEQRITYRVTTTRTDTTISTQ